jgi:hypothetical protein
MELSFLQKNHLLILVSIVLSLVITFVTNLLLPQQEENKSYIKAAILAAIVSGLAVYIHLLTPELETIITEPVPF